MKTTRGSSSPSEFIISKAAKITSKAERKKMPACRKDVHCHCAKCRASIDATRDLLDPFAVTLTHTPMPSRLKLRERKKKEARFAWWRWLVLTFFGVCFLWLVDSLAFATLVSRYEPKFTPEVVRGFMMGAAADDLEAKLEGLEGRIEGVVGGRNVISTCSSRDTDWEHIQGCKILLHWRCVIYRSLAEEVSVWGSPINSSGLLHTGFSAHSLTLLSGSIVQWSEGGIVPIRRSSFRSSWTVNKWSTFALQLDANTWVLDYKRSALFEAPGILQATWEVLRMQAAKMMKKLKEDPWSISLVAWYHECSMSEEKQTESLESNPDRKTGTSTCPACPKVDFRKEIQLKYPDDDCFFFPF